MAHTRQALQNIAAVLAAAGAAPEHRVRMTWYITDCREYTARLKEIGAAYRQVLGKNSPAMICVQVVGAGGRTGAGQN